jgi:alkanesulfonate monooxygenase SsuD/methylene tetrahydromethanopterin reductase-like flavin-dependent oxidoreductase (luciferase family)
MTRIQFGFVIPAEIHDKRLLSTYAEDVNRALDLATGHFDSAWVVDHLQFGDTAVLEGFSTLAYFAALHPQLHFGHSVLCQSFRNPALVAKIAATLQHLSGGRYFLGIGAGWHEEEYSAYGYDFPSDGVRVEQTEEALQIIRAMWTEEQATLQGRHYRVAGARCEPKPDPVPPIMVGAFRPKMLRLTAKYADWWNVSSTGEAEYRRMAQEFGRACDEVGRAPSTVRRSWGGGCACAPTHEEAERLTSGRWSADDPDDFGFVGTPDEVIQQMRPLIDLGVDYFMLDCAGFPALGALELLIDEVLPVLNH